MLSIICLYMDRKAALLFSENLYYIFCQYILYYFFILELYVNDPHSSTGARQ